MNIKKRKTLIILLIIFICLLISYILFIIFNHGKKSNNESNSLIDNMDKIKVTDKINIEDNTTLDKDTYHDKIITDKVTSINYDNKNIHINDNGELYIDDSKINTDILFNTLYDKVITNYDDKYLFLISIDQVLYILYLNDLDNLYVREITTLDKVLNFTSLGETNNSEVRNLYILLADGNIYEALNGLRYDNNKTILFNNIIVFSDKTLANVSGYSLKDKNSNKYKVKYAFMTISDDDNNYLIIITDDNRYITISSSDGYMTVYENPSKVKNITYDNNIPQTNGNLKITLSNNKEINIEAMCGIDYCINN